MGLSHHSRTLMNRAFNKIVGVGYSNEQPGGDPNWNKILSQRVQQNPMDVQTGGGKNYL
jgi:hypothetical protein